MKDTIETLRDYFTAKGLTQVEVAERLGVTKAYINAIFTGRSNIGKKVADKIEKEFGISAAWLLTGKGNYLLDDFQKGTIGIPLVPIDAVGGALSGTDAQFTKYDCEQYIVPIFKGADFLIRVQGDSMQPKYTAGDIVACKIVPLDKLWFQWGKTYVLDTRQGALIKRLEPSGSDGFISIHSYNEAYKPFDLPVEEINGVALVVGTIRVE